MCMLDVRRLKVLCEVARHGSFSAAAEALGYSQPAVSRQIATLEAETGATLVRRAPHGAVLTDAGRLLATRGEALIAQLATVETELGALAGLEAGRLRLASFTSAAASIVPLAIAEFRSRHPAVEITITMADPVESLPLLRAGELDLAISHDPIIPSSGDPGTTVTMAATEIRSATGKPERAVGAGRSVSTANGSRHVGGPGAGTWPAAGTSPGAGTWPGAGTEPSAAAPAFELVPLFDDPMYVAMPRGHFLADVEPLGLERFADEPWMLATSQTCPDSRLFLRACHDAGFEPKIAFQNDDYPAILGFVAAGVGVALVPDMVARGIRDDVIVRELDPAPPPRPIIAVLPSGYRSPAAVAMLAVLADISDQWVANRPVLALA